MRDTIQKICYKGRMEICFLKKVKNRLQNFFIPQAICNCEQYREEIINLKKEREQLKEQVRELTEAHKVKDIEIEELRAKLKQREAELFGKKTEKKVPQAEKKDKAGKKRGQKEGGEGHGRKLQENLPIEEEYRELLEEERCCGNCGLPYADIGLTEDSEEVEIDVKAYRKVIKRKKYKQACKCEDQKKIITAPEEEKLIPKGGYAISFWVTVLLHKYLFQYPLQRLVKEWEYEGLEVSPGTIIGGLKTLAPLFVKVEEEIRSKNIKEGHWHVDETRWMVFVPIEGKKGYRWWLWVFRSRETVVFIIHETRSAIVPEEHFGEKAQGIINADRFSVYKKLAKTGQFIIAFCWSHVRRDFIEVEKGDKTFTAWTEAWLLRIGNIYALNNERLLLTETTEEYQKANTSLYEALSGLKEKYEEELEDPAIKGKRHKVLESLKNHWKGLLVFYYYPFVPMDNNTGERALRNPVLGRKMYYGSGSLWSVVLTAGLFTIFQTLDLWKINCKVWMTEYLKACAANGGKPLEDVKSFLPWDMNEERLRHFRSPPYKELKKCATAEENFQLVI